MSSRATCRFLLALVVCVLAGAESTPALAGQHDRPAATRPSIANLFSSLSDGSEAVRQSAEEQLMGLPLDQLPVLRRTVLANLPLRPGEWEALHEIVTQVFLANTMLDGDQEHGFMGVRMEPYQEPVYVENDSEAEESIGVIVQGRTPGFAAYRILRDGDLILSIRLIGTADEQADSVVHPVHTSEALSEIVKAIPAGRKIALMILRDGRRCEVEITLGARPRDIGEGNMQLYAEFLESQMQKAMAYWDEQFAAVVDSPVS